MILVMNLQGKTVAITGASGGIGKVLAKKLAAEGAKLILTFHDKDKEALMKQNFPGQVLFQADFTKDGQVEKLIQNITEVTDEVDVLINAAGIGVYEPLEKIRISDWDNSFAINVRAPFLLTQKLLPLLQKSSDSLVVNIGSGAGTMAMKGRAAYCATKFALRGMTLTLAEEFAGRRPQFCLITLGSTLTSFGGVPVEKKLEWQKQGRAYFTVEWVADRLVEIVKNDKREVEYVLYPGDYGLSPWKRP